MKKTAILKVLILISLTTILSGCNIISVLLDSSNEGIIFGTGSFENGIDTVKNVFSQDEDILLEATTENEFKTTTLHFTLLKNEADSEIIYEEWEISVDPTWNSVLYEFHLVDEYGEFEIGDYIVRIFDHNFTLLTEGTFSIE